MSQENPSQLKFTLNYGAILGITLIIVSIIFYVIGFDAATSRWSQWLYYAIMIGVIIFAIKSYRDNNLGGAISFGLALGTGVLVALFGSIIYAAYSYIFLTFIDATVIDKIITAAEEDMINRGMSDEQIEQAMSFTRTFMASPGLISVVTVLSFTFFGFIFSLLISLFMKKNPVDRFDQETSGV